MSTDPFDFGKEPVQKGPQLTTLDDRRIKRKRGGVWVSEPLDKPKRKKPVNHNDRTFNYFKAQGLHPYRVEGYDPLMRRSKDLMGIFDYLVLGDGLTMAVQVTSKPNVSSRRKKIKESPNYAKAKAAGWRVLILSWDKPAHRWIAHEEEL